MDREIRTLSADDLDDVVKIHLAALSDDVLPNLGKATLQNYYKIVLTDGTQLLFGVMLEKRVVGFCQVSIRRISFGRIFCNINTVIGLGRLLVFHPRIFYSGVKQVIRSVPLENGTVEISFIAVAPEWQGSGLGKVLLMHAIQFCRKDENITSMQTKTANEQLRNFYVREYCAKEFDCFKVGGQKYFLLKWSIY